VLAIVEDKQHPLVLNGGDQLEKRFLGAKPYSERGRHSAWHEVRITERRKIDQPNAVLIGGDQSVSHGEGEGRLSDPARSGQRD
jgi:hypothetical protein